MSPTDVAMRYFECVRAKDIDGWMALFAEDALYVLPDGSEFAGKQAIRAFQEKVFGSGSPFPTPLAMIASRERHRRRSRGAVARWHEPAHGQCLSPRRRWA